MAWKYIVVPDPDFHTIEQHNIGFARNEKELLKVVQNISSKVTEGGVCVYELSEIHKMVEKPKFARYKLNANGEILPV